MEERKRLKLENDQLKLQMKDWQAWFESLKSWVVHRFESEKARKNDAETSVLRGNEGRQVAVYVGIGKTDAFMEVLNRINK